MAWQRITGNLVYPVEYDILFSMDSIYCDEMNKEIVSRENIHRERQQKEAELNSRTRGKR